MLNYVSGLHDLNDVAWPVRGAFWSEVGVAYYRFPKSSRPVIPSIPIRPGNSHLKPSSFCDVFALNSTKIKHGNGFCAPKASIPALEEGVEVQVENCGVSRFPSGVRCLKRLGAEETSWGQGARIFCILSRRRAFGLFVRAGRGNLGLVSRVFKGFVA